MNFVTTIASSHLPSLVAQARPSSSQIPNPVVLPNRFSAPAPTDLPSPPARPKLEPPPVLYPSSLPPSEPATIRVRRFEFRGNTVFSQRQLEAVVAPFTNRDISIAELLQASNAVTKHYIDRGYIASGALLLPGGRNETIDLRNGIVVIQVVEGEIERINVSGDGSAKETRNGNRLANYVQARLNLATRPVLNADRLLEALRLLQRDPRIKTISALINPGSAPNTRVLDVRIVATPSLNAEITLNNQANPLTGSLSRGIQVNQTNLLGFGDDINMAYANTDGANTISAAYTIPVNARNGTLQLNYNRLNAKIIRQPFAQADIRSASNFYDLTFRQPVLQRATERNIEELAVGVTASRSDSRTSILGAPFPLSPGSDDQGRTRISAIRVFQEWTQRNDRAILVARSQFNIGINALNSTINRTAPDSRFLAWRGQVQWLRTLNPKLDLLLRSDVQLSDRALVPTEQFSVGGPGTVRGYAQNTLLADNGILGSAELNIHLLRSGSSGVQLIPFVDIGKVWNTQQTSPNDSALAAVGMGIQWIDQGLRVRANYAVPLTMFPNQGKSLQEKGFDFSVQYSFSF